VKLLARPHIFVTKAHGGDPHQKFVVHDVRVGALSKPRGRMSSGNERLDRGIRTVIPCRVIVDERNGSSIMPEAGNYPDIVGEMIDRALDVLAGGAIKESRHRLLETVGEPGARCFLLRYGLEFGELF